MVAAVRMAPTEELSAPSEETALERAVAALTIISKKKWQSGRSRGGGRLRGGQGGGRSSDLHCKHSVYYKLKENVNDVIALYSTCIILEASLMVSRL